MALTILGTLDDSHDETELAARLPAFDLVFRENTFETRGGKPVCTLDFALRLIDEFHRLFPEKAECRIVPDEFVKRDDEKEIFAHAYDVVRDAVFDSNGVERGTKTHTLPEKLKWKCTELIYGFKSDRPNIQTSFSHHLVSSPDELFGLIDEENDPFGRLFVTTALDDLRVDLGALLQEMSHGVQIRAVFPSLHPEAGAMRQDFRRLIDDLLGDIGLEEAGPAFSVINMGHPPTSLSIPVKKAEVVKAGPVVDVIPDFDLAQDVVSLLGDE